MDASQDPIVINGESPVAISSIPYHPYANQSIAAASIEVRSNVFNGAVVPNYVVGRHRDKPDTIVIDPVVPLGNVLGLPFNPGFLANREYTWRVPATSGIRVGGKPALPVGTGPLQLPIVVPGFTPAPGLGMVFRTGDTVTPDPDPPTVLEIVSLSGASGQETEPIGANEPIEVIFDQAIDRLSIDELQNFIIRNVDRPTLEFPQGRPVGVQLDIDEQRPYVVTCIPVPSWGPGVSAADGYEIEVRIGTFGDPSLDNIVGLPQGLQGGQIGLDNSLPATFHTQACPECEGSAAIIENFSTQDNRDGAFAPTLNACRWDEGEGGAGLLRGVSISGDPLALFQGNPGNIGTRSQVSSIIGPGTTLPLSGPAQGPLFPVGLFTPFDAGDGVNNLGPGINGGGGGHLMIMYEGVDLGGVRDSLELIEWGPTGNTVFATTYPSMSIWCGQGSQVAPSSCPSGGANTGLAGTYLVNYDQDTLQAPDPNRLNPLNPTQGGVLCVGPSGYTTTPGFSTYFPYQTFTRPFDYLGSGPGSGALLVEMNTEPGTQLVNFHRYRSVGAVPAPSIRRFIGGPLGTLAQANVVVGSGCDIYDWRFTFVSMVSSAQSNFYDTGVNPASENAIYRAVTLSPSPQDQTAATSAIWRFEGAAAIAAPNTPVGPTTGLLTWWNGTPGSGTEFPEVLEDPNNPAAPQLSGNRYFRFQVELRNDHVANTIQSYSALSMAISVQTTSN